MDLRDLSEDQQEELRKLLNDKYWRLNNLYYIKDKNSKKVLFRLNDAQEEYYRNKHNRNVILKARQKGFTTLACIDALDDVIFNSYFDAGIIAHNLDDAEKIFTNKVKFAYDNLPKWLKEIIGKPSNNRAGELRFPNDSSISVDTSYRGGTLRKLHVSEYGKICVKYPEKAKEIKTGAFEAVPLDGEITVESTAEGVNGDFYDMCEKAQLRDAQRLTQLDFKFHFFPWWKSKEYRLNPEFVEFTEEFIKYFKEIEDDHDIKLDEWQKAWYIKKTEELNDEMKQEYPSFSEESFMASGRPVFPLQKIAKDIKRARSKTPLKGFINDNGVFTENPQGTVMVFKKPKDGMAYAIGGDPAEGLETGDNSAASGLDKDFEQAVVYCGKMDPDLFGKLLVKMGKYYNNAILAPEQNNHGHAVLSSIKNEKYYRIYRREVTEELGQDIQEKVGWLNTAKSKMKMIDDLIESYRDGSLIINCEATLREMMTIVYEEDGNIILNGKDRVVALGISIQAIKQASLANEHRAFIPGKAPTKDVTKMSIEEKMAYYKRMQRV